MGYNKLIRYADVIELYEYERDIIPGIRRSTKRRSVTPHREDLDAAGEVALSERQLGKRQDNAGRASLAFRRILASNLGGSAQPLLVTLTCRENLTDLKIGYQHYRSFIKVLRNKYGKAFKYACVPEFQKRGAVHFHALFWGLPAEVFLLERQTRTLAGLWGRGFIYLKETDGNEKLSFYLAKYMAKAFTDPRLKNQKSYVTSRNIERPIVEKGFSPVWPVLDDFVGEDNPPVVDKKYTTRFLGKGRHRIFKVKV
jgi:hypothetical protein